LLQVTLDLSELYFAVIYVGTQLQYKNG
jgi:hypothetical protein